MEFKIEKTILSDAIASLNSYVEKKDLKSIVANILVKIDNCVLTMYATDYDFGLSLDIVNIQDSTDGEFLVNATNFLNIIKRLKAGEVHIILNGNSITIKQNKSKLNLEVLPTNDFPKYKLDESNMQTLDFKSSEIVKGIKNTLFSVDNNNPKYELQSMLFDFDKTLKIVSTDTRSLSVYDTKIEVDKQMQLLIPKKSIVEIQKLLLVDCTILFDNTNFIIKLKDILFHTKLINGKFPAYQRVIPERFNYEFEILTQTFIENIKLVTALEPIIKISFGPGLIKIESNPADGKNIAVTEIENENINANDVFIKANSTQLLNALNNVESSVFKFMMNEHNLPMMLQDGSFKVINMPYVDLNKGE